MKLFVFKSIFCILLFIPFKLHASDKITVLTGEWPPYISSKLENKGIVGSLISNAFKKHDIETKFIFKPWKRAIYDLKDGKGVCSPCWTKTPEREKSFLYSKSVIKADAVFFHLKGPAFKWNHINDLNGLIVGGTLGYNYGKDMNDAEKRGVIKVLRSRDTLLNFRMLLRNRVHLVPEVEEVGYYIIQNNFSKEDAGLITNCSRPYRSSKYYIVFSKKFDKSQIYADIFNSEIDKMKKNGMYQKIIKRKWKHK